MQRTHDALELARRPGGVEQTVLGAEWTEGIVLRYGVFYGPGTSLAPGEEQFELVHRRKFPLVGNGGGVWSFIHISDAAEATVAAVELSRTHARACAHRSARKDASILTRLPYTPKVF